MNLIYRHNPSLPLTQVHLIFPRSGACLDPAGRRGLGRLALRALLMGAGDLNAEAMSERLERLGANTGSGLNNDHVSVRLSTLTDQLDRALELFNLSLTRPRFDEQEFARIRAEHVSAWRSEREESKQVRAQEVFMATSYEHRPHAYLADGLAAGLAACTVEEAAVHYHRLLGGAEPILAVLSDLPEEEVRARIVARLELPVAHQGAASEQASAAGNGSGNGAYPWDDFTPPAPKGRSVVIVPEPDTATDEVFLGAFSAHCQTPDWHHHRLISLIFGGDMNSRLFRQVRGERGYSYGASCWYEAGTGRLPRNQAAPFSLYTFPSAEHTAAAVPLMVELYEALVEQGITEEELSLARTALTNSHPFRRDTPEKQLALEIDETLYGIVSDDDETNAAKLAAVTPAQLLQTLQTTHHPRQLRIVLLGDPARLEPVAAALPGVEKIETVRYPE